MKQFLIILSIIVLVFILYWCNTQQQKETAVETFSGFVLNYSNNPIEDASILINKQSAKSDSEGRFTIEVDSVENYIMSIEAVDYGPVNKIYDAGINSVWKLGKATTDTFDAGSDISLVDNTEDCIGSMSQNTIKTSNNTSRTPLVYNSNGSLIGFKYPPQLKNAYEAHVNRALCNKGVSVFIPGGSLRRGNQQVTGNVKVSVSTIDLFAADAMPGNYTVSSKETPTYMVSVGAGSINVYQNGKKLQLNPKATAVVTIPIDQTVVTDVDSLPDRIPFLIYIDSLGEWQQKGFGTLNNEKTAYVANTDHLSTFNMDHTKTDPSCIRFCFENGAGVPNPNACYPVEVTIPEIIGGTSVPKVLYYLVPASETPTCPTAGNLSGCLTTHIIKNLPNNTPIGFRVFNSVSCAGGSTSPTTPPDLGTLLSSYVIYSGPMFTGSSSAPDCGVGEYENCAGNLVLSENPLVNKLTLLSNSETLTNPPLEYTQTNTQVELSWIYRVNPPNTTTTDEITEFKIYYRSGISTLCEVLGAASPVWLEHPSAVTATGDATYSITGMSVSGFSSPDLYEFKVVAFNGGTQVEESACLYINVNL